MFTKFNFSTIIKDHTSTLKNHGQKAVNKREFFAFFVLPALWGISQIILKYQTTDQLINLLVTSASIFAGLLLNLLVLLYTVATRPERKEITEDKKKNAHELLKETFFNISFSILISVLLVISCLVLPAHKPTEMFPFSFVEFFVYYFGILLILSILLVLKRIHALLRHELTTD